MTEQEIIRNTIVDSKRKWWAHQTTNYNKGLFIAGITTILITGILFLIIGYSGREFLAVLLIGTFFYLLYIGTLNALLILTEVIGRQLTYKINNKTGSLLFKYFFWISAGIPMLYPCFIFLSICMYGDQVKLLMDF